MVVLQMSASLAPTQSRQPPAPPPSPPAKDEGSSRSDNASINSACKSVRFDEHQVADDTYMCFNPKLGYVLKTYEKATNKKIFVNILHHDLVNSFLSAILDETVDKKHNDCGVFTVVIPTYLFLCSKEDESVEKQVGICITVCMVNRRMTAYFNCIFFAQHYSACNPPA